MLIIFCFVTIETKANMRICRRGWLEISSIKWILVFWIFFFLLANEKYKHLFWWDISFISRFCVWQSHHRFVIYVNAKCHSSIPFHISVEINFVIPIEQLVPRRWLFMSLFICFPMIITQSTPECQRKWFIYYTFTFEGYDSRVMLWGGGKEHKLFRKLGNSPKAQQTKR